MPIVVPVAEPVGVVVGFAIAPIKSMAEVVVPFFGLPLESRSPEMSVVPPLEPLAATLLPIVTPVPVLPVLPVDPDDPVVPDDPDDPVDAGVWL